MAKWVLDDMTMNEYQEEALTTAIYPEDQALAYLSLKLCGEAGEVAEKIGKSIRDDKPLNDKDLAKELGDVLWYVTCCVDDMGQTLENLAWRNAEKLASRMERGVIQGDGDTR